MTRDDIIKMAGEAVDPDIIAPAWDNGFWTLAQDELERFARLMAAAEREACAKVCEGWAASGAEYSLLDAIRARGAND